MNTRKTNNGNERMQGGRSRGGQRKDHFREGGMNSYHNNNYSRYIKFINIVIIYFFKFIKYLYIIFKN